MKLTIILLVIGYNIIFASKIPVKYTEDITEYETADLCQPWICKTPDCKCTSIDSGGNFPVEKTPQLVMVTFDDAVTALNYEFIEKSLYKHKNPDGCPAQATFYVSHEYTDYSKVHNLWANGHEIALHSITHSPYNSYWRNASVEKLLMEFGDQKEMIAHFANIPSDDINGMRMPLFQLSGDNSYIAMVESGIKYDSSWPTNKYTKPGLWPYTLDFLSTQDCSIGDCPTTSIPGAWVQPILNWEDTAGLPCAMVDACLNVPDYDVNELLDWMKSNFHRIYESNRAPFGVHLHAAWFGRGENTFGAFIKFLNYLAEFDDVYLVSTDRVIEYTKNPVPIEMFEACAVKQKPSCNARTCVLKKDTASGPEDRYMTVCSKCPEVYPWLGNPFGEKQ
uniref:CSON009775 protein n=1 Tax=Culicoides sonorensis TaxID=179676 RepID=A0A336M0N0_CULSO